MLGEGDYFGQPVVLRPFQRRFLYRLYEFYPETNRRRYRRALWGMAKGNGKTPIAACIAAAELAAGLNISPRVIIGAASLKQANYVFGDLRSCFTESKTLKHAADAYDLQIVLKNGPGIAERVAAVAGANDGARATCFLADELHEWIGRLARVFIVIDGAIAKRLNAFTGAFTTAGIDDEESLLKQLYTHGQRVASGEVTDDQFLFEWYEAPSHLDLDDPDQWLEAIHAANPAAGDFCSIENLRYRFQTILRGEFERYHTNRFVRSDEIWEVASRWPELVDPSLELDPVAPLHVAIDVGLRHDSSAVVAAQVGLAHGNRVALKSWIWENPYTETDHRHDEWTFNMREVENVLRELHTRFPTAAREKAGPAFYYDKTFFETSAADLLDEGLNMEDYPQTDSRMVPASQRFFQLAVEGRLVHDGDAALARHVSNVVPHEKPRGWRISKPRGSRAHIDGAIAAAIAAYEATRTGEDEDTAHPSLYI